MKRTIATLTLTAALLLTIGAGSTFARGTNSSSPARSTNSASLARSTDNGGGNGNAWLRKDFSQAELLDTKTGQGYTCFTFKMSGMVLNAYYSNQGELLAVTHNITSTQLPLTLLMQVKREYANYWISDLFEMSSNGESTYFITLENADKTITLRSSINNWNVFNKTTKV